MTVEYTEEGFPIWVADYVPGPEVIEGEVVQPLRPLNEERTAVLLTPDQLGQIILQASALAFRAAEGVRQSHATTPDGRHDKTIHNYKPVPYHQALQESSTLKDVPYTGTEVWKGDSVNPIPSSCAHRLFLSYPKPLLLAERVSHAETQERESTRQAEQENDAPERTNT